MRADIQEVERILSRVPVERIQAVDGQPDMVKIKTDERTLRAVKTRLMREDYDYRARASTGDWYYFQKHNRRSEQPRNRRQVTRDIQRGDFRF